jgi:hypothetical protein
MTGVPGLTIGRDRRKLASPGTAGLSAGCPGLDQFLMTQILHPGNSWQATGTRGLSGPVVRRRLPFRMAERNRVLIALPNP